MKTNDVAVVVLSFGDGPEANKELAKIALKMWQTEKPRELRGARNLLVVQKEIAIFIPSEIPKTVIEGEGYLNTYDVLKKLRDDEPDLKFIYLFAHPAHRHRSVAVAKKLKFQVFYPEPYKIPWARNDPQWWVRNPALWWPREIVARIQFKWKGWT